LLKTLWANKPVLVPGKPLQLSLMFVSKAELIENRSTRRYAWDLIANMRLGNKKLAEVIYSHSVSS